MAISASIKKLFKTNKIPYRVFSHERTLNIEQAIQITGIDKNKFIRTEVLADEHGTVLAVVPLEKKINFTKLKAQVARNLIVLSETNINKLFVDCEAGAHPPFGEPYNLLVLLDSSIEKFDKVYFRAGSQTSIVQLAIEDFLYLQINSQRLAFISNEKFCQKVYQAIPGDLSEEYDKAIATCNLPRLSQAASKVLRLIKQDNHAVDELIQLIVKDDIINKQILNYAKLPFLAKEQTVTTIDDAVKHILGFDTVSQIALGVAATQCFNVDKEHNNYLRNFWRHALCAATLTGQLAQTMQKNMAINSSMAYMTGLFHNFGFLLLAQLFPPEFTLLNKWLNFHANIAITALEQRLLGMGKAKQILRGGHSKLGAWLLKKWELPEQVWVVAKEHHNPGYQGKYAEYVRLIYLVNKILRQYKIGDEIPGKISSEELAFLNLTAPALEQIVLQIMAESKQLEQIAVVLANSA